MTTVHLTPWGVTVDGYSLSHCGNTLADKITELLMLRTGFVSEDDLMDYAYPDNYDPPGQKIIAVIICRHVRPFLMAHGIDIEVRRGWGWRIIQKPRVFLTKYNKDE